VTNALKTNNQITLVLFDNFTVFLVLKFLCFIVGLCGFLPIYPKTAMRSARNRAAAAKKQAELAEQNSDTQADTDTELNLPQS